MKNNDLKHVLFMLGIACILSVPVHATGQSLESDQQDVEIYHTWAGDFPVSRLSLLPAEQDELAVGYIDKRETFAAVWKLFRPEEAIPEVDFKRCLVLFTRNTRFYNRISIGRVMVKEGIAEVAAMETMSAMPIEDKVGMSLAVVPKKSIKGIKVGDDIMELPNN